MVNILDKACVRNQSPRNKILKSVESFSLPPWSFSCSHPFVTLFLYSLSVFSLVLSFYLHPADRITTARDVDDRDFTKKKKKNMDGWSGKVQRSREKKRNKELNECDDKPCKNTKKRCLHMYIYIHIKERIKSAAIGMRGMSCFGCVGDKTFSKPLTGGENLRPHPPLRHSLRSNNNYYYNNYHIID